MLEQKRWNTERYHYTINKDEEGKCLAYILYSIDEPESKTPVVCPMSSPASVAAGLASATTTASAPTFLAAAIQASDATSAFDAASAFDAVSENASVA